MKEEVKNKKGVISEYLPWIIIALVVLAIMVISIALFRDKGATIIDSLKNLFGGR